MPLRPSEWLRVYIHPLYIYRENKLLEMAAVGIKYDDGMLTSLIPDGTESAPYSTMSRHASVRRLTPREVVALGATLPMGAHEKYCVIGHDVVAAVWHLLHPILESGPPSDRVEDNVEKMRRDLAALQRYGY
jgi:hypothetical protein